jgi:hypothetical protein
MSEPTNEQKDRWTLFQTAVLKLAKESGFDGAVVAAYTLPTNPEFSGGRLFSVSASGVNVPKPYTVAVHATLAHRLMEVVENASLATGVPLAEA